MTGYEGKKRLDHDTRAQSTAKQIKAVLHVPLKGDDLFTSLLDTLGEYNAIGLFCDTDNSASVYSEKSVFQASTNKSATVLHRKTLEAFSNTTDLKIPILEFFQSEVTNETNYGLQMKDPTNNASETQFAPLNSEKYKPDCIEMDGGTKGGCFS